MPHTAVAPQLAATWLELTGTPVGIASSWSERHAAYAAGLGTLLASLFDPPAAEAGVTIAGDAPAVATPTADPGRGTLDRACEAALAHWSERLWSDAGAQARRYLAGHAPADPPMKRER